MQKNKNKHFIFNYIFPVLHDCYEIVWKIWYRQTGHRLQHITSQALGMLGNYRYRHTIRICNRLLITFLRQQWLRERASILCLYV